MKQKTLIIAGIALALLLMVFSGIGLYRDLSQTPGTIEATIVIADS